MVENPPANAGAVRDAGLIPGSGRLPGGGHGNSLQYSCLENPMGRGAWWAIVHRAIKSWTWLKQLSRHAYLGERQNLPLEVKSVKFYEVCSGSILKKRKRKQRYPVVIQGELGGWGTQFKLSRDFCGDLLVKSLPPNARVAGSISGL